MIDEKINQAVSILNEQGIDCWITYVRESSTLPDPVMELIVGAHCTWPSAFIITASGNITAIVGSLDKANMESRTPYSVIGYVDSIKAPLIEKLNDINPQRIAINYSQYDVMADGLSYGMYLQLTGYLKDTPFLKRLESSEPVISALRGRKSKTEITSIQSAIDETLSIYNLVTRYVKVGMCEKEIANFINQELQSRKLEPAWDNAHCPAVFTGPESAGAHAEPTDRIIEPGHIMNIDFGVRKNDYVSDLQRTWYFLKEDETTAPEAVKRGFTVIYDAIQKATKSLRPGMEGWQIDEIARSHITSNGYQEYPHALGHQVGRKAHDGSGLLAPRWDRYKKAPYLKIEADQVYTLEPRLTVEGHGIATIEEIVLVTESGCRFLSEPQSELYLVPCNK